MLPAYAVLVVYRPTPCIHPALPLHMWPDGSGVFKLGLVDGLASVLIAEGWGVQRVPPLWIKKSIKFLKPEEVKLSVYFVAWCHCSSFSFLRWPAQRIQNRLRKKKREDFHLIQPVSTSSSIDELSLPKIDRKIYLTPWSEAEGRAGQI